MKRFTLFLVIFFLILNTIGIVFLYIYDKNNFIYKNVTLYNYSNVIREDISKQEAEFINLLNYKDNIKNKNKDNFFIKRLEGTVINNFYRSPIQSIIFIEDNGNIDTSFYTKNSEYVFIEQKDFTKVLNQNDLTNILNDISNLTKENNTVVFSSTMSYFLNFENIIQIFKEKFNQKKLIQVLNLRWGDEVNYNNYSKYKTSKNIKINGLNQLNTIFNEFWIEAFDYTTVKSILPGPLISLDLFTASINYYTQNGISLDKLVVWINTLGYMWPDRYFENNHLLNYIFDKVDAKILENTKFDEIINNYPNTNIIYGDNKNIQENLYIVEIDKKKFYLIKPSEEFIKLQIDIAREKYIKGTILF